MTIFIHCETSNTKLDDVDCRKRYLYDVPPYFSALAFLFVPPHDNFMEIGSSVISSRESCTSTRLRQSCWGIHFLFLSEFGRFAQVSETAEGVLQSRGLECQRPMITRRHTTNHLNFSERTLYHLLANTCRSEIVVFFCRPSLHSTLALFLLVTHVVPRHSHIHCIRFSSC